MSLESVQAERLTCSTPGPRRGWDGRCLRLGVLFVLALAVAGWDSTRAADPNEVVLSPRQAAWRYLDTGVPPDESWNQLAFDDSAWLAGPAPLGFDPEVVPATVVGYGPDPGNKFITTWFRRSFVVTNADSRTRLLLRTLRDDGVVVYLNGKEVFRSNLPPGEITPETLATEGVEEPLAYRTVDFPFRLRAGTNLLAAEVHQWNPASEDLWFDAELTSAIVRGPYLLHPTPRSILIRWRTPVPTLGFVDFGTSPAHFTRVHSGAPAPVVDHAVLLTNLLPDTRYLYRVGAGGQVLADGPDLSFRTAPIQPRPTRIWVLGDSGTVTWGEPWAGMTLAVRDAYLRFARTRPADLWLMLGDNAYYQGYDSEYQAAMFDVYQQVLPSTPIWSTLGNHDAYSLTPDGRLAYYDIFSPPAQGEAGGVPSGSRNYYSFDYGGIHFVCLDSMLSARTTNGPMWTWLEQDLTANTNDWLIAFWHHPPYSKGNHDSDNIEGQDPEMAEMREVFLPLLEAHGVDLVLAGHSHNYERSGLLYGHYGPSATLQPQMLLDAGSGRPGDTGAYRKAGTGPVPHQGTVYVVTGSAGSVTGGTLDHPAMFVSLNQLGSVVLDVDRNRLDARFIRETGAIDDSFTILKGAPAAPFQMVGPSLSGNQLTLRWKSEAGRVYRVQGAPTLVAPQWSTISPPITASGVTTSWSAVLTNDPPPVIFRVEQISNP